MYFISILKFHVGKLLLVFFFFYYMFFRPDKRVELGLLIFFYLILFLKFT